MNNDITFCYDNNGNNTVKQKMTYSDSGTEGYSAGNVTTSSVEEFEYNLSNQMTGYINDTTTASYTYNADGLRKSKTVNGTTTNFIWNGNNLVKEDIGTASNIYLYGAAGLTAKHSTADASTRYYLRDYHGNIIGQTDTAGTRVSTAEYDAFGNKISGTTDNFGYCGEYTDAETGYTYLRARYYDPASGRFTTEDPAKDGMNWYVYCGNDPVNRIDPTGLDSWVFYDGEAFGEQAKTEADNLENTYGTEVHLIDIWSLEGFLYNWDNMINSDNSIDGVSMLFHGSPYTIYLGEDGEGDAQQLTSSVKSVTPNGSTGYYVGNLKKAEMQSINVMSCNGGHLDLIYANKEMQKNGFNHNIAVELLLTQDTSIVYGMDGSLAYTKMFGNYYPRLAWDQEHYKSWTPSRKYLGKRSPSGKIAFWINDEGGVGYWPMWQ